MMNFSDIYIEDIMKTWKENSTVDSEMPFTIEYKTIPIDLEVDITDEFISDLTENEVYMLRAMVFAEIETAKIVDVIDMMYEEYADNKYRNIDFLSYLADTYRDKIAEKYANYCESMRYSD